MQTFAHQAVLAMRNARLFSEVDHKGRELALAHDTVQRQAAKGNHNHSYNNLTDRPIEICTSDTRPADPPALLAARIIWTADEKQATG